MVLRTTSFLCIAALLSAAPPAPAAAQKPATVKKVDNFKPFTGKLLAGKVRLRAKAELEGPIVRQMNKNDLLLVIGEEGDFYAVAPMKDTKAYVFRSYVLDGVVEANRVNVRLEPHVDAPVIGQLQAGDKVQQTICAINHKWLEIAPPKGTRFFVAKEFVSHAGGPELLAQMEKRKSEVEQLLSSALLQAETECKKAYEEMAPNRPIEQFQTIIRNFSDFPDAVQQAKEALVLLKETYLNKKIAFLEKTAELSSAAKQELLAKHKAENSELLASAWSKKQPKREVSGLWDAMEESLYLSWSAFHSGKTFDDFYSEQKANASVLTGTLERYTYDVKNKPGDFLLRSQDDAPLAYVYSTQINLDHYEGKTVTLLASPRPNNHFAFPAYYVFSVE